MTSRFTIKLGKVFGIPIGLDPSWFLIFALVTWSLASGYFPSGWSTAQKWIGGAIAAIIFFVSVLLHELSHSLVAEHFKIPVRSITLFIFGGVSDIGAEPPTARAEFLMALAGPLMSLVLGGIFVGISRAAASIAVVATIAGVLGYINLLLGVFNLIPGFPLDGGRVFRAIVWGGTHSLRRATTIAATVGRVVAFGFILYGVYELLVLGNIIGGIWIAFIGFFLESAAGSQVQAQRVHDLLAGHTVSQAMSSRCAMASPDLTLQQLVDEHVLGSGQRCLVLSRNGGVEGLMTLHNIRQVPRDRWDMVTAREVMTPAAQVKSVAPTDELTSAMEEMDRDGVNQLPVLENGEVVGMISREDVLSYLRTLREIGR